MTDTITPGILAIGIASATLAVALLGVVFYHALHTHQPPTRFEPLPATRALIAHARGDKDLARQARTDTAIFADIDMPARVTTFSDRKALPGLIQSTRPDILHMLARFNESGDDAANDDLREILTAAEACGVRHTTLAAHNDFRGMLAGIPPLTTMSLLIVTHRNRHLAGFLRDIVKAHADGEGIMHAYTRLVPHDEQRQKGLPLPGSVLVCHTADGGQSILWSYPQL